MATDADVCLLLDDGTTLSAHSIYLQHSSSVFQGALTCSSPAQHSAAPKDTDSPAGVKRCSNSSKRLPLPGTTSKQALLLLHCLYS